MNLKQKSKCSKELYCQFLLAAQSNFTGTEMSDHLSDIAHDSITRWLRKTKLTPSVLWEHIQPLIDKGEGYLVCDDSLIAKNRSEKLPLASWQYSGAEKKILRGVSLVTLLWSKSDEHIPVDYRIYAKKEDGYTKNQHFCEMLKLAHHRGLKPKAVVFDSWYASKVNLEYIDRLDWTWITQLKANRVVNYHYHLRELDISKEGTIVHLKMYGDIKVFKFIASDGDIEYHATNNLNLSSTDIRRANAKRWKIEEYHRGLKQLCGIEKCQSRTSRSQRTHIFCSIITFLALELNRLKYGITCYQTKRKIIKDAITNYLKNPTIKLVGA